MLGKSYINRISETNSYCNSDNDVGTVIHGADWYEIAGGMQDYGYLNYGTIELTMEISCCKYPDESLLSTYWNYNRDAMIELLFQAQRGLIQRLKRREDFCFVPFRFLLTFNIKSNLGVKGFILNEYYQPISNTQVMIDNRRPVVNVTPSGEFWRILLPGSYTLKVKNIKEKIR
jgi:hypothetical protein